MRIVWRYVLSRFLASLLAVLTILILLVFVIEILLDFDVLESEKGIWLVFLKILSSYLLQYMLPAAALFGAFISLGSAARAREFLALKAGGISPIRASLPILAASVLLAGISYLLLDTVVVAASQAFNRETRGGASELSFRQGTFWYHSAPYVYNFADLSESGDTVHDVVVFERDDHSRLIRRIGATSATVVDRTRWRFNDATTHHFDPEAPDSPPRVERAEEVVLDFDEQPSAALLKWEVAALSSRELRSHIAHRIRQGRNVTRGRALLHDRYSEPIAVMLFSLLAIPIGLRVEQTRSLSRGALQAVLAMFAYYSVRQLASTLAAVGVLPAVTNWATALIVAGAGVFALSRLPR
ncbi:MAG: LptF/LptG family permease [Myxococcota bacterium]